MITLVSLGLGSSFIYDGQEYIIVNDYARGGFNLNIPDDKLYKLPQPFYCGNSVTPEYLTYICDKYIGVKYYEL